MIFFYNKCEQKPGITLFVNRENEKQPHLRLSVEKFAINPALALFQAAAHKGFT